MRNDLLCIRMYCRKEQSMNLAKEILRLPNFYYEYFSDDGKLHLAVLGGNSCRTSEKVENLNACREYFRCMDCVYEKEELTEDDKRYLASNMHKIQSLCDSRKKGLHTLQEQENYLNTLQTDEIKQLEQQVKMYKDARQYYSEYIYRLR